MTQLWKHQPCTRRLLLASVILGSVSAYAQCISPVTLTCVNSNGCRASMNVYEYNPGAAYTPATYTPVVCYGVQQFGYYNSGYCCCEIIKNLGAPATSRALARLSAEGPVFLVACNGDLVPFSKDMAQERPWSPDQALPLLDGAPRGKNAADSQGRGPSK